MMKNTALLVFYQVNTTAFVEAFCVNKFRPQLHCDGKCKLASIIKEKEQKEAAETLASMQTETVFIEQPAAPLLHTAGAHIQPAQYPTRNTSLYRFLLLSRTDKPPQAIA
ncbi:MAG: hypothetical protein P0Y53_00530 [Candidatus Pseudobacter hemicellulosilyticus]|uniref:Uncharacterized protein n=1 Tax=Candidatus Pseudobacter hemicellulosilyticus TaxID=3121375 RepID=A0AAJ5WX62_9BACT|nr:MAG: hypothetical protein P0Y53_00530 [Pseudobacter sp.]